MTPPRQLTPKASFLDPGEGRLGHRVKRPSPNAGPPLRSTLKRVEGGGAWPLYKLHKY